MITSEPKSPHPTSRRHSVIEESFGAAGDGRTNDRAAIQAAIDAAAEAGGGEVLLPGAHVFVSGNLFLRSDVTLRIDGVLRQSQDPAHYTYPPLLGHRKKGEHQSHITWFDNLPLVFARHCRNVTITGSGTIEMSHNDEDALTFDHPELDPADLPLSRLPWNEFPDQRHIGVDHHTIHVAPIALYQVSGFEISGLKVHYGNTHHILVYACREGLIRDVTVEVYPTPQSYGAHHVANTDAVHLQNSQHVRVTGNHFDQIDNTVVVIARYGDPREETAWWSTRDPQPTHDVEIDHNFIRTSHGGVVFLPWAPGAPDLSRVEISDVRIHHNVFDVGVQPQQIRADYVYDPGPRQDNHSPIKDVVIRDNDYVGIHRHSRRLLRRARITGLVNDFQQPSHATFLNADFRDGLAFWSTQGESGWLDADNPSALASSTVRAAAAVVGGHLGWLQDPRADSALFQGLGLTPGPAYRLRVRLATDAGARLFVREVRTGDVVTQRRVHQKGWHEEELIFRTNGSPGCHHVGVDHGDQSRGWILVASMHLEWIGEVVEIDDPRIRLEGPWHTDQEVNLVGRSCAETTEPGAVATVTFDGTRAWWFGLRDWIYGRAEVWLDGTRRGTAEGFNTGAWPAWVDHQVLVDTGDLPKGQHTLRLVCTGDRHEAARGTGLALDALLIETDRTDRTVRPNRSDLEYDPQ